MAYERYTITNPKLYIGIIGSGSKFDWLKKLSFRVFYAKRNIKDLGFITNLFRQNMDKEYALNMRIGYEIAQRLDFIATYEHRFEDTEERSDPIGEFSFKLRSDHDFF